MKNLINIIAVVLILALCSTMQSCKKDDAVSPVSKKAVMVKPPVNEKTAGEFIKNK